MNDHDARMLTAWFDANEVRGSEASWVCSGATKGAPQRPGWLVSSRRHDRRRQPAAKVHGSPLLAATALIVALVAGAVIGGGGITPRPIHRPPAERTAERAAKPLADAARRDKEARGLVAFTHIDLLGACPEGRPPSSCYEERLWVANPDGSNAHELLPGVEGRQIALAGHPTAAGSLRSRLRSNLTDASGSEVRPLNAARSLNLGAGQIAFRRIRPGLRSSATSPLTRWTASSCDPRYRVRAGGLNQFRRGRQSSVVPRWRLDRVRPAGLVHPCEDLHHPARRHGPARRDIRRAPRDRPQLVARRLVLAFTYSLLVGNETRRHLSTTSIPSSSLGGPQSG